MNATPRTDTCREELAKIDNEMRRLYQRQQQIKSDYAAAMAEEVCGITRGCTVKGYDTLNEFKRGLRGMVVLSGYRCQIYDDMLGDWSRVDRISFADGARDRVESLWLSPNCVTTQMRINEVTA